MRRTVKKGVGVFIAAVMCFSLLAMTANASSADFTIENGVLTEYKGTGGNVIIPNSVTSIGENAFYSCENLTSVTIPNSVTSIGNSAFALCEGLTSVTIPNSVTSIDNGAFNGCTRLTGITIPNSVTSIGGMVFMYCTNLTSVAIPASVTSIGDYAFMGCTNLTSVTIPVGVTIIERMTFAFCESLTSVTIPDSVTGIIEGAFIECISLTSVTIPNSVTYIQDSAFAKCTNLISVTIPDSVTGIGPYAFNGCESLTAIYGKAGSYAETYSKEQGIPFSTGTPPAIPQMSQVPAQPVAPAQPGSTKVNPTPSTVYVNGTATAFEAYNIGGANYFKLRDLAYVLNGTEKQFEVGYDTATKAITLTRGQSYTPNDSEMVQGDGKAKSAIPTPSTIYLNGNVLDLVVYNIGGSNFFKLRELMKAIDVYVGYDSATRAITLDTRYGYLDE